MNTSDDTSLLSDDGIRKNIENASTNLFRKFFLKFDHIGMFQFSLPNFDIVYGMKQESCIRCIIIPHQVWLSTTFLEPSRKEQIISWIRTPIKDDSFIWKERCLSPLEMTAVAIYITTNQYLHSSCSTHITPREKWFDFAKNVIDNFCKTNHYNIPSYVIEMSICPELNIY